MQEMTDRRVFDEQVFLDSWDIPNEHNSELLALCVLPGKVTESLSEGLGRLKRDLLKDLAQDLLVDIKSSSGKAQLVEHVSQAVVRSFADLVFYLPVVNLHFLRRFGGDTRLTVAKDELLYRDISHSHNLGYLMVFDTGGTYTLVLPRVFADILAELDFDALLKAAEFHQRIAGYAISLTNLYGVLDIDQFSNVWNRYEVERLTPASAGDELAVLTFSWYSFWYENEYIVSSYFETYEAVEEFLSNVKDIPYYVPSRQELRSFFTDPYDESSPAAQAMRSFLSEYDLPGGEDFDDLMADLADVCIADTGMDDALGLLQEYGILFKGLPESDKFSHLYAELDNHARKWVLRGHTKDGEAVRSFKRQ